MKHQTYQEMLDENERKMKADLRAFGFMVLAALAFGATFYYFTFFR